MIGVILFIITFLISFFSIGFYKIITNCIEKEKDYNDNTDIDEIAKKWATEELCNKYASVTDLAVNLFKDGYNYRQKELDDDRKLFENSIKDKFVVIKKDNIIKEAVEIINGYKDIEVSKEDYDIRLELDNRADILFNSEEFIKWETQQVLGDSRG